MKITIEKDSSTGEYRVPAEDGYEDGAYYTADRVDAIDTCKAMHGKDVVITFRSVPEFVGGKYEKYRSKKLKESTEEGGWYILNSANEKILWGPFEDYGIATAELQKHHKDLLYSNYMIKQIKKNIKESIMSEETQPVRPIYMIAKDIKKDWKPVYYAAKPYLDAMSELESITDKYMYDSARSIIAYFLENAKQWKGEKAKEIKKELNNLLKSKPKHMKESTMKNNFETTLEILKEGCKRDEKKLESLKKKLEKLKERFAKIDKKVKPDAYAKTKEDIKSMEKEVKAAEKACK